MAMRPNVRTGLDPDNHSLKRIVQRMVETEMASMAFAGLRGIIQRIQERGINRLNFEGQVRVLR